MALICGSIQGDNNKRRDSRLDKVNFTHGAKGLILIHISPAAGIKGGIELCNLYGI